MITVSNLGLQFSDRKLFDNVNLQFKPGNCYGVIGANGAGKSTFLKVLSKEIESTSGSVIVPKGFRITFLKQDHFAYDENVVLETVILGHARLFEIMKEKDEIYNKPDFNDEDGMKAAELEGEFAALNGWEAESEAAILLNGLGVPVELHDKKMKDLKVDMKVKVLLAQALFGNPDVLLLDEPTNNLDVQATRWLEEYLINFENTVIVVSHNRHFLNKVCTHICDVDFGKIKMYIGNYDFWYESSQLALRMHQDTNKKKEEKMKELQDFIARFSANASKSKQATSRKKVLDKITLDDIGVSSRRYPYIGFEQNREVGDQLISVEGLSKTIDGVKVLDNVSFTMRKNDRIAFIGNDDIAITTLFKIIMGEMDADSGEYKWGVTTSVSYMPRDNTNYFMNNDYNLIEWLRQYSGDEEGESFIRSFLGRMLFSGDETFKKVRVLSGGEKMRLMFSKMMLTKANIIVMDDPTNHLDLESITALNNGMLSYKGSILFASHDHQLLETVANRIIEITPNGVIDREMTYEEYVEDDELQAKVKAMYEQV